MDISHAAPSGGSASDNFVMQGRASRSKARNSTRADAALPHKRCALPGCQKPVSFDVANPRQRNDYCGQDHARKLRLSLNKKDFVLTPAMRACAICGQRHLDRDCPAMRACAVCDHRHLARDCPHIMLSDPGAPATSRRPATPGAAAAPAAAAAAADTARPATPGAAAPLPAAAHTAAVVAAAAATAHPAAPGAAAASSDPDGPGAANAEAPPPGPRLLDQGPDTVAAAPPSRPPALSPRGRQWLPTPTGDAAPNAPLPAAAAVERRDARVARNYEEFVERRDAHVAQTYDALSSNGSEYAPHPRQRTMVHTAADNEWFTAARKERSAALFQIDALESRLRLARDHYQDLLRAVTDQQTFIVERDARDNALPSLSTTTPTTHSATLFATHRLTNSSAPRSHSSIRSRAWLQQSHPPTSTQMLSTPHSVTYRSRLSTRTKTLTTCQLSSRPSYRVRISRTQPVLPTPKPSTVSLSDASAWSPTSRDTTCCSRAPHPHSGPTQSLTLPPPSISSLTANPRYRRSRSSPAAANALSSLWLRRCRHQAGARA